MCIRDRSITPESKNVFEAATLDGCPVVDHRGLSECSEQKLLAALSETQFPEKAREFGLVDEICNVSFYVSSKGRMEELRLTECEKGIFESVVYSSLENLKWHALRHNGTAMRKKVSLKMKFVL